jgi:hypothetical protein
VLAGREAEIAGKVAGGGKALYIAHGGHQGGGGQEADARNSQELADAQGLGGGGLELLLDGADARVNLADLLHGGSEGRAQQSGDAGVGVLQLDAR